MNKVIGAINTKCVQGISKNFQTPLLWRGNKGEVREKGVFRDSQYQSILILYRYKICKHFLNLFMITFK